MNETDAETPAVSASVSRQWDWRPKLRWFAAEIAVVVAGVLIALALNAWWGARQDAATEARYLARLARDVRADTSYFRTTVRRLDGDLAVMRAFADAVNDPATPDSILVARASVYFNEGWNTPNFTPTTTTYDDLTSTGNLSLILDEAARNAVVELYNEYERLETSVASNREWLNGIDTDLTIASDVMRWDPDAEVLYLAASIQTHARELRANRERYVRNMAPHYWYAGSLRHRIEARSAQADSVLSILNRAAR